MPDGSIGQTTYADHARKLNELINSLRAIGAQEDIDLPRIAVIGNQSAGKSSLVEAISRIKVPRASGTCTRCPMECRLKYSNQSWSCQVKLRWERDEDGAKINNVREIPFGNPLSDENELETVLKRAQLAILNPSVDSEKFVNLDLTRVFRNVAPFGDRRQLSFSSNVVCVDISSPLVTDLSFIDLPGIIANVTEEEDEDSIILIRDLVENSIQGNTLILLTITMRDDMQNQAAAMMAKKADPSGERTIGVLTKPDTVVAGELAEWIGVLSGKRERLRHGYYVTKQPGVVDLKRQLSFDEARAQENVYFKKAPWTDLDSNLRSRIGTRSLTQALSNLLSDLIDKSLPELRRRAKFSLTKTLDDLMALPPPPSSHPFIELIELVTLFCDEVVHSIEGTTGHEALMRSCREIYEDFKGKISSTRPHFIPFTENLLWVIRSDGETSDEEDRVQGTPVRSEYFPSLRAASPAMSYRALNEEEIGIHGMIAPTPDVLVSFTRLKMNLADMRAYLKSSLTRELPLNVPYSAKVQLFKKCFIDWRTISVDCFESVYQHAEENFTAIARKVFARYQVLYLDVREVLENVIDRFRKYTREEIDKLLALEEVPFTLNSHYYCSKRTICLRRLSRALENHLGSQKVTEYEQELIIMAECEAYYWVAFKRIMDNLPRVVDQSFLKAIPRSLQPALMEKFGTETGNPIEKAKRYLQEDREVSAERSRLIAARDRLEQVIKALSEFNTGTL